MIEAGFSLDEIYNMTISQLKMHLAAATKKQAVRYIQNLSLTAVGSQGAGKDIKKTIEDLEKSIREVDK